MRKVLIAAAIALSLGGCADFSAKLQKIETTVSNAVSVVASTKIDSDKVYIAINVFNAAERSVTAYLRLPPCGSGPKLCRAVGAADALEKPFLAGIQARNDLRAFMRANPGTLADAGAYNTLTAATEALQNVMNIYGLGSAK